MHYPKCDVCTRDNVLLSLYNENFKCTQRSRTQPRASTKLRPIAARHWLVQNYYLFFNLSNCEFWCFNLYSEWICGLCLIHCILGLQWFCEVLLPSNNVGGEEPYMPTKYKADHQYRRKDYLSASITYEQLLSLLPKTHSQVRREIEDSLARCYLGLGRPEEALSKARQLVSCHHACVHVQVYAHAVLRHHTHLPNCGNYLMTPIHL